MLWKRLFWYRWWMVMVVVIRVKMVVLTVMGDEGRVI